MRARYATAFLCLLAASPRRRGSLTFGSFTPPAHRREAQIVAELRLDCVFGPEAQIVAELRLDSVLRPEAPKSSLNCGF